MGRQVLGLAAGEGQLVRARVDAGLGVELVGGLLVAEVHLEQGRAREGGRGAREAPDLAEQRLHVGGADRPGHHVRAEGGDRAVADRVDHEPLAGGGHHGVDRRAAHERGPAPALRRVPEHLRQREQGRDVGGVGVLGLEDGEEGLEGGRAGEQQREGRAGHVEHRPRGGGGHREVRPAEDAAHAGAEVKHFARVDEGYTIHLQGRVGREAGLHQPRGHEALDVGLVQPVRQAGEVRRVVGHDDARVRG
ncbi:MAG: hypothetical protein ACK559_17445, partial [bacterium]